MAAQRGEMCLEVKAWSKRLEVPDFFKSRETGGGLCSGAGGLKEGAAVECCANARLDWYRDAPGATSLACDPTLASGGLPSRSPPPSYPTEMQNSAAAGRLDGCRVCSVDACRHL